jgi:phosphohistidine phosphatase SixA
VPVYLVRHACAGDKQQWFGPDLDRPLDDAGVHQAEALANELAAVPIHRILTSPAQRCRQTIEPLANRLDLPVEPLAELLPNGASDHLSPLIAAVDASAAVICTHGELMRPLLARLRQTATRITARRHDDDWLLAKGTAWALSLDPTGTIVAVNHRAPYPVPSCPVHHPARP